VSPPRSAAAQERPERPGAAAWVPEHVDRESLAAGVSACRGCELYRDATHGVAGEGPLDATVMMVGEQPGDQEDREGRPFVGPAGRLLGKALDDAGLDPTTVYRTNAVKHFRWDPGRAGKRIHKGPGRMHVVACGPWLAAELDLVRPGAWSCWGPRRGRRSSARPSGSARRAGASWTGRPRAPRRRGHRSGPWRRRTPRPSCGRGSGTRTTPRSSPISSTPRRSSYGAGEGPARRAQRRRPNNQ
jgi:uracil-DNA glycosylase